MSRGGISAWLTELDSVVAFAPNRTEFLAPDLPMPEGDNLPPFVWPALTGAVIVTTALATIIALITCRRAQRPYIPL